MRILIGAMHPTSTLARKPFTAPLSSLTLTYLFSGLFHPPVVESGRIIAKCTSRKGIADPESILL
jgi:hypothetical protein